MGDSFPGDRFERQGGIEKVEVRRREARLHALACHDVAEAVRDQRRAALIKEAERAGKPIARLEGLENGLVIVQAGVAVPGHADEAGVAAEGAQPLEGLRMPATGGLRRDAITVEHHDPARGGLRIRQAGRISDRRRPRRLLGRHGLTVEGLGVASQFDLAVHRFDGADRHRQFQSDDDLLVLKDFQPQWADRGAGALEQEDAMLLAGDVQEELSRKLDRTVRIWPEDFGVSAGPGERRAEDR